MSERVKVLRVIARLNMGGPALHVAYLTEGLAGRGYDTTLVAGSLARGEDSMAFVAEARGVEVVKIDELHREISPLRDLVAVFRLARLIRAERPQILHTHTAKAGAIGRILDKPVERRHEPPRPGDIRDSWADVREAERVLGYRPSIDLEEGLRRTIESLGV